MLVLFFGTGLKAQLPSPPYPPRLVNDYTGTLSASQISTLERKLVAYNDSTSTQILVLLVNDRLDGISTAWPRHGQTIVDMSSASPLSQRYGQHIVALAKQRLVA